MVAFGSLKASFESVRWMNPPAPPGRAYQPTQVEHIANILTHGLYLLPVIHRCWVDLIDPETLKSTHSDPGAGGDAAKPFKDEDKAWACLVYGLVTIGLFAVSTFFHLAFCFNDQGLLKQILHRCDRAMIYIFIAGSYTPWLTLKTWKPRDGWGRFFRWAIWPFALLGIIYQQLFHERFKLLETTFYILIGVLPSLVVYEMVDDFGLDELKLGGVIYLIGVVFFKLDGRIPFAHAIWHLHVVAASKIHYDAVIRYLVKPPTSNL